MRRPLVAGNWKMHGTGSQAHALAAEVAAGWAGAGNAELAVCPPFPYLPVVRDALERSPVALGAQNVCSEAPGAVTGEVAAEMLCDLGCRYVIVGHSERRALFAESDEQVARKFARVVEHGMTPVLCVGETLAERDAGRTFEVVERQLAAVTALTGAAGLAAAVLAYEPVWAIGTGRSATPEQAQEVHAHLRGRVAVLDTGVADALRILYGGSVKPGNAVELFSMPDIDGGLIGGASLEAASFLAIGAAA